MRERINNNNELTSMRFDEMHKLFSDAQKERARSEKKEKHPQEALDKRIRRKRRDIFYGQPNTGEELSRENFLAWQEATDFLREQAQTALKQGNVGELANVNRKFNI